MTIWYLIAHVSKTSSNLWGVFAWPTGCWEDGLGGGGANWCNDVGSWGINLGYWNWVWFNYGSCHLKVPTLKMMVNMPYYQQLHLLLGYPSLEMTPRVLHFSVLVIYIETLSWPLARWRLCIGRSYGTLDSHCVKLKLSYLSIQTRIPLYRFGWVLAMRICRTLEFLFLDSLTMFVTYREGCCQFENNLGPIPKKLVK